MKAYRNMLIAVLVLFGLTACGDEMREDAVEAVEHGELQQTLKEVVVVKDEQEMTDEGATEESTTEEGAMEENNADEGAVEESNADEGAVEESNADEGAMEESTTEEDDALIDIKTDDGKVSIDVNKDKMDELVDKKMDDLVDTMKDMSDEE